MQQKLAEIGECNKNVVNIAQRTVLLSAWHELHTVDPLSREWRGPARNPPPPGPAPPQHIRGSLEGAHLVLISARSRTTAITGADPSPVAGSEV